MNGEKKSENIKKKEEEQEEMESGREVCNSSVNQI